MWRVPLMLCIMLLAVFIARADTWLPAEAQTVLSADKRVRATVTPRLLDGALAYFRDKVDGRAPAGQRPGSLQTAAQARVERKMGRGDWTLVWEGALTNDVAPVTVLVANSARYLVTLDNWHSMGWGDDAVAIYGPEGALIRRYGLSDLLPAEYVAAFPRSASSIHWRGDARIVDRDGELRIDVVVPSLDDDIDAEQHLELGITLADGRVRLPEGRAWQQALETARAVNAAQQAEFEAFRKRRATPLVAPRGDDERQWQEYLAEAVIRQPWIADDERLLVVPRSWFFPRDDLTQRGTGGEDQAGLLLKHLQDGLGESDALVVCSPDAAGLADLMRELLAKVADGSLGGARIVFVGDQASADRISAEVARAGGRLEVIDTRIPVPGQQLPERPKG